MCRHRTLLGLLVLMGWLTATASADLGDPPELSIELVPDGFCTQVGDNVTLYLVLRGPAIGELEGADDEVKASGNRTVAGGVIDAGRFQTSVYFRPKEEGFSEVGPLSIRVAGQTLTSNTVEIRVFPDWEDGEQGYRFQLSHEEVRVDQPFEFVVRSRMYGDNAKDFYFNAKNDLPGMNVRGRGSSSSSGRENGERVRKREQRFIITPTEPGEIVLTPEFFREVPEGFEMPELIVDVLEAEE